MRLVFVLVLVILTQVPAPKTSMLGKAKPWWEMLKRGDVVRVRAIPGTAIPLVKMWRFSEEQGQSVRDDVYATIFSGLVDGHRWSELHRMVDLNQVRFVYTGIEPAVFTVFAIHDDPVLKTRVVDVMPGEWPSGEPLPDAYPLYSTFRVPVAYLGGAGQPRHPELDRMPVMVRRSRDLSKVECSEPDCVHMDAISFSEAEKAWKAKQKASRPR